MGLTDRHRSNGAGIIGNIALTVAGVALIGVIGFLGMKAWNTFHNKADTKEQLQTEAEELAAEIQQTEEEQNTEPAFQYYAEADENTSDFSEDADINSRYALLIDPAEHRIVAERNADTRMNPASMTKVLTILVAAENIDLNRLNEAVEITQEANDFAYVNDCSTANFIAGDRVTLRDLFYGTILPSGGEAAYQLAMYTAGSHDAFVDLMNQKLEELGLADSAHFTNCIGINNDDHYCTVYDMAIIMEAAMENDFCREVLSAHKYTTSGISVAPDGETLSNKFLRRIEDKYTVGTVIGAKTGYTDEAGNCAVSYATAADGKDYICVTGAADGNWICIRDHVEIYTIFTGDIQANLYAKAHPETETTETAGPVVTTEESEPEQ